MSFFEKSLVGRQIDSVYVDSEVTYLILGDGTQVAIRGLVFIEPANIAEFLENADAPARISRA